MVLCTGSKVNKNYTCAEEGELETQSVAIEYYVLFTPTGSVTFVDISR